MNKEEKLFLKKVIDHKGGSRFERGVISPATLFNCLGGHDNDKLINKLISFGYIEEAPNEVIGRTVIFYRPSAKGYAEFGPWYKKAWQFFTDDMAKVVSIISLILSIIATIVSFYKNNI
jgi:hypothetical protein